MSFLSSIISKSTSSRGINNINSALILISLIAAYILPFEVFLFSYAVLGPLHYLTEISWLDKKKYFVKTKSDIWLLVLLVLLITFGMFNSQSKINNLIGSLLFSAFIYAFIILFVEKTGMKLILVFITFVFSLIINMNHYPDGIFMIFAVFLPTIIHVYVFTALFIFFGALKSRSRSGIISFILLLTCGAICFIYMPETGYTATAYSRKAYGNFSILNTALHHLFGFGELNATALFESKTSIAIMRFIAFAYTYHYLNWFSKTTVIKWNQISIFRMTVILVLWIVSVGLYAINYKIGFYALFLLSLLHVFLEFPLNHTTFIGIGKEIRLLVKK